MLYQLIVIQCSINYRCVTSTSVFLNYVKVLGMKETSALMDIDCKSAKMETLEKMNRWRLKLMNKVYSNLWAIDSNDLLSKGLLWSKN